MSHLDLAPRVLARGDLPVLLSRGGTPARAPLAHSKAVAVASSLEEEAAQVKDRRIADGEPHAVRLQLDRQLKPPDPRACARHQGLAGPVAPRPTLSELPRVLDPGSA